MVEGSRVQSRADGRKPAKIRFLGLISPIPVDQEQHKMFEN